MATGTDLPDLARRLTRRLSLRARDLRTGALVLMALVLAGYTLYSVSPDIAPGASGNGLPGQVQTLRDAIFGEQALKHEDGYPRLQIPRLGIDLLIAQGDGHTPPAKAKAWVFPGTAFPGAPGNSYVYAHARAGAFLPLKQGARIGDEILIDDGGGKVLRFRMAEIHSRVDYRNFQYVYAASTGPRLTLQTCTGYNDADPRFVVVALPEGS